MSYPNPPVISYSYGDFQLSQGDNSFPGTQLDNDLSTLKSSISALNSFVRGITRADGKLANGIVTKEALSPLLTLGVSSAILPWTSGTAYQVGDLVSYTNRLYSCVTAHTAGTFATDLTAGNWALLADFTAPTISDGSIGTAKLADDAVTAAKIAAGAVGASELADLAVDTAAIQDGAVTTAKIASKAVTAAQIADDTITAAQIAPNAVGASELADGAVDTAAIQDGAVTFPKRGVTAEGSIPAAATTNIWGVASDTVEITSGSGPITSFGSAPSGSMRFVRLSTGVTLKNGANLVLPTGADIVGNAGDTFIVKQEASNVARVLGYQRADGKPLTAIGGFTTIQKLTTSGNFTVPAGITKLRVTCVGAGGGGSGTNGTAASSSGSGGGAAIAYLTVTPGQVIPYAIGAGGSAGGLGGSSSGGNGGSTSFGSGPALCAASGGVGGSNTTSNASVYPGGDGTVGDILLSGAPGWPSDGASLQKRSGGSAPFGLKGSYGWGQDGINGGGGSSAGNAGYPGVIYVEY